jgi:hypothetical protein
MANIVYENSVIESKMTELIDSKLALKSVLTVDNTLKEGVGLTKIINKYTYTGAAEELTKGQSNSVVGAVTFTPSTYVVKRIQQTFTYNDMDIMADPYMLDAGMAGAAAVMVNQILDEYIEELGGISNRYAYSGDSITYDDIVDALAALDRETEDGMVILIGSGCRAAIRKDADFIASRQGEILYTGQIGTLCGLPVVYSRKIPGDIAIITSKDAVRFFVKREATVEQDRNVETKENIVVYERHGLIALVDDTGSVIIGKAAAALSCTIGAGSGAGKKAITVGDTVGADEAMYMRLGVDAPVAGETLSTRWWTVYESDDDIAMTTGQRVALAIVDKDAMTVKKSAVFTA